MSRNWYVGVGVWVSMCGCEGGATPKGHAPSYLQMRVAPVPARLHACVCAPPCFRVCVFTRFFAHDKKCALARERLLPFLCAADLSLTEKGLPQQRLHAPHRYTGERGGWVVHLHQRDDHSVAIICSKAKEPVSKAKEPVSKAKEPGHGAAKQTEPGHGGRVR